jgi:cobaltochelatase CobS
VLLGILLIAPVEPKENTMTIENLESDFVMSYETKGVKFSELFPNVLEDLKVPKAVLRSKLPVREYELPNVSVPDTKEYFFRPSKTMMLINYLLKGEGQVPYLYGLHGTGKTTHPLQICARLGLPVAICTVSSKTEVMELSGQMLPTKSGGMDFFDGLLLQSMKNGWVLIIDEFDLLHTLEQKALNTVMELGRYTVIQTGEEVVAHPDFRVILTGNTNNTGSTGMFGSTGMGDASVNDRYLFIEYEYLEKHEEQKILEHHAMQYAHVACNTITALDVDDFKDAMSGVISKMIDVANDIRRAHKAGQDAANGTMNVNAMAVLECTMSTRALISWLEQFILFKWKFYSTNHVQDSFDVSFANGIRQGERETVKKIVSSFF